MIICTKCGHRNPDTESFCASCGSFLEWTGEKQPTETTPVPGPAEPAPAEPAKPAGFVQRAKVVLGIDEATGGDRGAADPLGGAAPAGVEASTAAGGGTAVVDAVSGTAEVAPAAPAPVVVTTRVRARAETGDRAADLADVEVVPLAPAPDVVVPPVVAAPVVAAPAVAASPVAAAAPAVAAAVSAAPELPVVEAPAGREAPASPAAIEVVTPQPVVERPASVAVPAPSPAGPPVAAAPTPAPVAAPKPAPRAPQPVPAQPPAVQPAAVKPVAPARGASPAAAAPFPAAAPAAVPSNEPAAVKPAAAQLRRVEAETAAPERLKPGERPCPQCGFGNDAARRLCRHCGAELATGPTAPARRRPWWRRLLPAGEPNAERKRRDMLAAGERPERLTSVARPSGGGRLLGGIRTLVAAVLVGGVGLGAAGYVVVTPVRTAVNDAIAGVRVMIAPTYQAVNTVPGTASGPTNGKDHTAQAAFDGYNNTWWSAPAAGQPTIVAHFAPPADVSKVLVTPGNAANFQSQQRPRTLRIVFRDAAGAVADSRDLQLVDEAKAQVFDVGAKKAATVEITVLTAFGVSGNTKDVAITEVEFRVAK